MTRSLARRLLSGWRWVATGRRPLAATYAVYLVLWWALVELHDFPPPDRPLDGVDFGIFAVMTIAMAGFWAAILWLRREWTLEALGVHVLILGNAALYGVVVIATRQGWVDGYVEAKRGSVRAAVFLSGALLLAALGSIARGWWRARGVAEPGPIEARFGVLASYMAVVMADEDGIIRDATPGFDELLGAEKNELFGQNLTAIMPEDYRGAHRKGLARYLATGQPRIIGRVANVHVLHQRSGDSIPVALALSQGWKYGRRWFIGVVWRSDEEVDL